MFPLPASACCRIRSPGDRTLSCLILPYLKQTDREKLCGCRWSTVRASGGPSQRLRPGVCVTGRGWVLMTGRRPVSRGPWPPRPYAWCQHSCRPRWRLGHPHSGPSEDSAGSQRCDPIAAIRPGTGRTAGRVRSRSGRPEYRRLPPCRRRPG